ncbi:PREDICTED: uncharacterized protein LOC100638887 isoform X2 [Amphimedon queenslandica]|uniref:F5/8 type C domain-containing protein n=1 Tax=Amphimedon queenslandica TaxID=400682 RepID=A0A1X7VLX4_AMPQE|nr:PREDICTED: uncharacterized protein LOC100638887 isoform X2 [Amphimedon queenslandica]|eukprot:XP_003384014.3 PREDICTED: uncharacterized protein LOC100638887 isoform X2 [Amphimedon queenslandica]
MSKEHQLLKYASSGNLSKLENVLKGKSNLLKRWLSKDRLDDLAEEEAEEPTAVPPIQRRPSLPLIVQKEKSVHVNVDCCNENGLTPLILASLNGHKDVVAMLLSFSADIHARDYQGNSSLHMAAWQNHSEVVDLLLLNGASPLSANKVGDTPLHYACQYCSPGKTLSIIKLLQHDASVLLANNAGDTPLDLAIRYNKKEAVAVLLDADSETLASKKTIIEAATKGRGEVLVLLLESGIDPNCVDEQSGKMPLHESVKYFRKEAFEILLRFGAQAGMRDGANESVIDIIRKHPEHRQDDFMKLIKKYHGQKPQVARAHLEKSQSVNDDTTDVTFTHLLLKNHVQWLKNDSEHCSAATKKHPVTNILDVDPFSYWMIPAPGAYNWVAFDLGANYTLTGVRIYGWGNKTMIYSFAVESANSLNGPWTAVGKYKADLVGPEDMNLLPEGQDFKGFYATSQFWRIVIADNYGDQFTIVSSVQFYGFEQELIPWFKQMNLLKYVKTFAEKGYNQLSEVAIATDEALKAFVHNEGDRLKILTESKKLLGKYYPPANLRWAVPPQTSNIIENKQMPEFSVMSDAYTVGELILRVHGGGQIFGRSKASLIPKSNGYYSRATFSNVAIYPAGSYTLEVQSSVDPTVNLVLDKQIVVDLPAKRHSEINRLFDDFESMMNF